METLVKEKILEQFVNEVPVESATIQPINVDIKRVNVTTMPAIKTLTTNDNNYFIRYGGGDSESSYRAIEVYSINSINNDEPLYVFDNILIEGNSIFILELKQDEDGRFYGTGRYYDGTFFNNYLIIFNNFVEDGFLKVNKYYSGTTIGVSRDRTFMNVTKMSSTGIYFLNTGMEIVKFEINILEGNKTSIASVVNGGTITSGTFESQLNIYKGKLIYTKLWETEDYKYEYTKAVVDVNEDLPSTVTLNRVDDIVLNSTQYVAGAKNTPYKAIIPWLNTSGKLLFMTIDINRTVKFRLNLERTFESNSNLYAYLEENYATVTDNSNIYLMYFNESAGLSGLTEFYTGEFSGYYSNTQILKQNNMITLIGTAVSGTQQSIVSIKNIYSPNTTSLPYYTELFCLPAYMNLYSDSNDNTSLIFSRDATARFYSGNQVTSTFIVPNYLLNDGNIEKASVYGKTNYLMNDTIEDYEKNRFESLYFNFIYNLNVIDNTNGLNALNQTGSNRIADTLWKSYIPMFSRLSKARITYEDLSTEIIPLNLVSLIGGTATFNYQVNGNITKIEYLSEDEKTVYSTYRGQITGAHTITQVVKIIPNETATLSGTSIYISDSSNLTFANIQISGNSVQNGTPTSTSPVLIKNAGDTKNLYYLPEAGSSSEITYSINEDGTINLSGTATAAVTFPIFKSIAEAQIENGATYTFSSNQALPSGVEFRAEAYNDSSWLRHLIGGVINSSVSSRTGTANLSNATRIRHLIYIASGTTVNITNLGIQFEKGDTQTSFTPEGKGFINETISNKNLFDGELELGNYDNNGNKISVNNIYRCANFIKVNSNTTYTISLNGVSKRYVVYYYDNSKTFISMTTALTTGTFTTPNNTEYITFRCFGADFTNDFSNLKIQIEKGSTATSYIAHQEQLFTIPCQQPMRSIGDIRDGFVKQDGVWYEKHNIGVIESYNGETITTDFISTTGSLSTGAFVQYVLDDANYIECTQEQIEALESIIRGNTYEPITNINSTDETPAYLNVTYYKQL